MARVLTERLLINNNNHLAGVLMFRIHTKTFDFSVTTNDLVRHR